MAAMFQVELDGRLRQQGETLPALAQEIRLLVSKGYPGLAPDGAEVIAIKCFSEALLDSELRKKIHETQPRYLEEAVQVAVSLEAWQLAEKRRSRGLHDPSFVRSVSSTPPPNELPMSLLNKILAHLDELESCQFALKNRGPVICYRCNKPGHIARNCRSPQEKGNEGQSH